MLGLDELEPRVSGMVIVNENSRMVHEAEKCDESLIAQGRAIYGIGRVYRPTCHNRIPIDAATFYEWEPPLPEHSWCMDCLMREGKHNED